MAQRNKAGNPKFQRRGNSQNGGKPDEEGIRWHWEKGIVRKGRKFNLSKQPLMKGKNTVIIQLNNENKIKLKMLNEI